VFIARPLFETAYPASASIIIAEPSQNEVHLINKVACRHKKGLVTGLPTEFEKIANCEGIRPQITARFSRAIRQSGTRCKIEHNGSYGVEMVHDGYFRPDG
jgi:hypothetical protein